MNPVWFPGVCNKWLLTLVSTLHLCPECSFRPEHYGFEVNSICVSSPLVITLPIQGGAANKPTFATSFDSCK